MFARGEIYIQFDLKKLRTRKKKAKRKKEIF